MFFVCLLGGWFGLHKFVEKKVGLGVLYLFTFGLFGIGWIIDCVKYYKQKQEPVFLQFKVAGVTFDNRQAILRPLKWGDETPETVDFEVYEYEGRPAVYVKINNKIVGNVPADTTAIFLDHENKYKRDNVHCDIYGGNKLDDGSTTNYGCKITIRYK